MSEERVFEVFTTAAQIEVVMNQVKHDVESRTRAQLLDLLELALPSDKFQLVKRNVDTIMRNMLSRFNDYASGVVEGDDSRLQHWMGAGIRAEDNEYVCGCGKRFAFSPPTDEERSASMIKGIMPEDCARALHEFHEHLKSHGSYTLR